MTTKFEEIVSRWVEITIFHKAESGTKELIQKIRAYMTISREMFFVFASGTAGDQACRVIAKLRNDKEISKKGYRFALFQRKEDMTGRLLYSWVFEKIG